MNSMSYEHDSLQRWQAVTWNLTAILIQIPCSAQHSIQNDFIELNKSLTYCCGICKDCTVIRHCKILDWGKSTIWLSISNMIILYYYNYHATHIRTRVKTLYHIDELLVYFCTGEQWSYSNWGSGQPDNSCGLFCFNPDCIIMRSDEGYAWKDYPCSSTQYHYYYVCEYGKYNLYIGRIVWIVYKLSVWYHDDIEILSGVMSIATVGSMLRPIYQWP